MDIWLLDNWKKYYSIPNTSHRNGVRLRIDKEVNEDVKRSCKQFIAWLRVQYFFPIRVPIYLKATPYIKSIDGSHVSATCFLPYDHNMEPYIRVASGDYDSLNLKWGEDNALAAILTSIAHELTHYFQWVNDLTLTALGEERQANMYAKRILSDYSRVYEHP